MFILLGWWTIPHRTISWKTFQICSDSCLLNLDEKKADLTEILIFSAQGFNF